MDAMTPQARTSRLKALSRAVGKPVMIISGAAGEGVPDAVRALANTIKEARRG
jgi:GTP-binding protein